jgi:hypothetical protein
MVSILITKHVTAHVSREFIITGLSKSVNLTVIDGEGEVITGYRFVDPDSHGTVR